jgi:8-oxo-dGTP pyrophosphatase MutT (NUDIX family)
VSGIVEAAGRVEPEWFSRFLPPESGSRESAVLILFGPGPGGEESLLLIERAHTLRSHAGQVAFPGGEVDAVDHDPVAAALREAAEEVLLDPIGVQVVGSLPTLYLPVSSFAVVPVVAWWRHPAAVEVGHPDEVAQVLSVPMSFLADPANRHTVTHSSGYRGPAWPLGEDLLLWGFTGGIVDKVLELGGWAREWDRERLLALPKRFERGRS